MSRFLNNIVKVIMVVGVIISFGNLKGFFIDKNRLDLYNALLSKQNRYRVSADSLGARQFLKKYYYSKVIPLEMRSYKAKGLLLKWMSIDKSPPMSGGVCIEFENGKTSTALSTLDELRQWVKESPFYGWLGWWLLAVSTLAKITIDVFIRKRNSGVSLGQQT